MYPCCWKIECSSLENLSGSSFPRESFPFPRSNFPFSRSGLSDLATLGQTTVRSRKRKIRSRKWKALSRKRNFAFKFFQLWAVSFQQHGTYISCWNSWIPHKFLISFYLFEKKFLIKLYCNRERTSQNVWVKQCRSKFLVEEWKNSCRYALKDVQFCELL